MEFLPLAVSLLAGAAGGAAAARGLEAQGLVRPNYRGRPVAFPLGIAIPAAALVALGPLAIVHELAGDVLTSGTGQAVVLVTGVALLGLVDDFAGTGPRGLRGHWAALASGRLTTGVVKAAGTAGLACFVLVGRDLPAGEFALSAALIVAATHVFNLLDLRPGRAGKAFVLVGAVAILAPLDLDPLWAVGLFVGPALALLPLDLRERGMLGDTGSSALGATAGLWLVLAFGPLGEGIALALLAIVATYGEMRSISALVERSRPLGALDSLGRIDA